MREDDKVQPITIPDAAEFFGKPVSTLRDWPYRYKTPKVGKVGRRVFYDMRDLETIDAFKNLGLPIPPYAERVLFRERTAAVRASAVA